MSEEASFGVDPPPFQAEAALVLLKRSLRDLRLTERGTGFEWKGRRVVELALGEDAITARLAKRLMLTPEWDRHTVRSGADQRKLVDEIMRRLERWTREDA
jgi:hypothetical protein